MKNRFKILAVVAIIGIVFALFRLGKGSKGEDVNKLITGEIPEIDEDKTDNFNTATFSMGCFWGPDARFGAVPGVIRTRVGYSGGSKDNPTYYNLGGHTETIQIDYDPEKITYEELLEIFWSHHNPTLNRKTQYKSIIFYHNDEQDDIARSSKEKIDNDKVSPVLTEIRAYSNFYRAEDYHQKYQLRQHKTLFDAYKNLYPITDDLVDSTAVSRANGFVAGHGEIKYQDDLDDMGLTIEGKRSLYDKWSYASGVRKGEFNTLPINSKGFQKPSDEELKKMLTPLQYKVTQNEGTEPAFENKYWDNKREGIYVDIVSGEILFSSTDKFQSGSGWPSFTKPIDPDNIVTRKDNRLFSTRTEVRSRLADSHLGHVFDDGPEPTGKRYCMNSAALRFIPRDDMEEEGYGEYLYLFEE